MEVFATNDESSVHFGGHDGAGEDTAADRDETGEGTFLIYNTALVSVISSTLLADSHRLIVCRSRVITDIVSFNRGLRCPEAQSNVLEPSPPTLSYTLGLRILVLVVEEDVRLLLERAFRLHGQLCRHDCS